MAARVFQFSVVQFRAVGINLTPLKPKPYTLNVIPESLNP